MLGHCSACKKEKAIAKWKGGVFCSQCLPSLSKSEQPLGVGLRFHTDSKGNRDIKGKKGDLTRKRTHSMRCNQGMNYDVGLIQ